jgi:NIPSNAP
MIVEHRTYTLKPGTLNEYFRLYQSEGLPIQRRYLPAMVGYYTTEIGPLNQVIHLWAYRTFEERAACRTAMRADPGWAPYLSKIHPLLVTMESKLLTPAPFFDVASLIEALSGYPAGKGPDA